MHTQSSMQSKQHNIVVTSFRTHATDLYICYVMLSMTPDTKHSRFEQHGESKRFLKTLQFIPSIATFYSKLFLANDTKGEADCTF